ncbi:PspA/IM30 family protein [Bacillaceae bacterium Marseille-Q3522]|nr:PspA/IM30 family protein [Bacillaceae bacterium Marseille-Q3522]
MGNLFTRVKQTVLADLNDALDKKEQKNPIALLNQYLRECEQETEKVKSLLERQYRLKDEFNREYHQADQMAEKRKQQAEIASAAKEAELTAFAAQEQMQYEQRAQHLKEVLTTTDEQLHGLEQKYEEMKHKLKDMKIRRLELMGKENVTRVQQKLSSVLDNDAYSNKAYSRFQEIEAYLERLEQRVNNSYNHSTIDARILQLEKEAKMKESHSLS